MDMVFRQSLKTIFFFKIKYTVKLYKIAFGLLLTLGIISCNQTKKEDKPKNESTYSTINVVGAMKNVMWKGELGNKVLS
jgi:hypothetical protein